MSPVLSPHMSLSRQHRLDRLLSDVSFARWLSVASTLCAYVVGALRGRAQAAQSSREEMEGPA